MVDKNSKFMPRHTQPYRGKRSFLAESSQINHLGFFLFPTLLIKITEAGFLFEDVDFPFAFAHRKMFAEETGIKVKAVRFR